MDRCRCAENAEAVRKLAFYTIGTYRPDRIANYDKADLTVDWKRKGVSNSDLKFVKLQARKKAPEPTQQDLLSEETKEIEKMWCPYMTPIILPAGESQKDKN